MYNLQDFENHINKIYCANSQEELQDFPNEVINLTITSPPFFDDDLYILDDGSLEFGWKTYEEYLDHMKIVLQEIFRITVPGGRCILVLSNSPKVDKDGLVNYYWPCIHDTIHLATKMGWKLQDEAIWIKNKPSYDDFAASDDPNIQLIPYHDWISIIQKPKIDLMETDYVEEHKNKISSLWELPSEGIQKEYNRSYGSFPDEFIKRCLDYWSVEGDLILDPYAGSGQTIRVALKNKRRAIGIEMDPKWRNLWNDING